MRNDYSSNYLAHHGILGMKWGVRRYQNPDGSLTSEGKNRYNKSDSEKQSSKIKLSDQQKKYLKIGAAVAGTALLAYGGYKLGQTAYFRKVAKQVVSKEITSKSVSFAKAMAKDPIDNKTFRMDAYKKYLGERLEKGFNDPVTKSEISKLTKEYVGKDTAYKKAVISNLIRKYTDSYYGAFGDETPNKMSSLYRTPAFEKGKNYVKNNINLKDLTLDDLKKLDLY